MAGVWGWATNRGAGWRRAAPKPRASIRFVAAASAWSTMEEIEAKAQKRTADGKRKPKDAKERRSDLLNSPKKARLHENEGDKPVGQERLRLLGTIKARPRRIWASLRSYFLAMRLHMCTRMHKKPETITFWNFSMPVQMLKSKGHWNGFAKGSWSTWGDMFVKKQQTPLVISEAELLSESCWCFPCANLLAFIWILKKWALLWVIISVSQSHEVTVAACSSMVDMLCSLLGSSRVPLAIALILVDLKVESTLRFGRWL